ncbi:MAG: DUF1365 domain-containing protein [Phycisphaerae bacterium]|nr:DUF1365 domain-containing protein [Phycisphaerae bacterium]
MAASAIFRGSVRHRRFGPVQHTFRFPLFMMYLDLAELPTLFRRYWLWSVEGWGLARFRTRDHLKHTRPAGQKLDSIAQLDTAARDLVESKTGRRPAGPIRLLTHLEYFGHRFNPVSFFYCFDAADQRLEAVIAEINNTPWGEQHCYVLDAARAELEGRSAALPNNPAALRWQLSKDFHISPFMAMAQDYAWRFAPPGERIDIHMENFESQQRLFDATLSLKRVEIGAAALAAALLRYPLMTTQVVAGIYWHALRLKLKGARYYPHPKTLATPNKATHG